jgi:Lrp/AsnC family leucine-responsive transcriptional regulator
MALDQIDYKIIDLLQQNGRMTQMEIAAGVGLSQPAVAERMRKLESGGVITGYAALVDPKKLGRGITAFIGVSIDHPKHNPRFARAMLELPAVLECHHVTGDYSYLLKVKTEDTVDLDRLISEEIRVIPGVNRTHTIIVMSSVKESTVVSAIRPLTAGKTAHRR